MLSRTELRAEGLEMEHCIGDVSFYAQAGAEGRMTFYRITQPQRAPLSAHIKPNAISIDKLVLKKNHTVSAAKRRHMLSWLETNSHCVSAMLV